jgi:predicted AlkP superfamily phosphohydrolase/phosphomutase
MRFLRMLTNSMLAGALGAAYLTVLVLQLNPEIPIVSDTTWRWFGTLGMLYGVHVAVVFYVVIVVREFFALEGLSPGWASVRVLAWMAAAAAASAAALMWLNVRGFAQALSEDAARRMTLGAAATSASAVVLLGIAILRYSFGRRGSRLSAALFVLAVFASIALPLAARNAGTSPAAAVRVPIAVDAAAAGDLEPGPRVVMLLLDGGSLEYVVPRVAEGRLPNLARLLEKGARIDLATIRPTQPDPVWAAVATGMYPAKNGVRSAAAYYARNDSRPVDLLPDHCLSHVLVRLGFVGDVSNSSLVWRAQPVWSILGRAGINVGIVRWPLTYPAPAVSGFVVSDRMHQLVGSITDFDRAAYPPETLPVVQQASSELLNTSGDGVSAPESLAREQDRFYSQIMRALNAQLAPRVTAVRYGGLDTVGHYYLKYTDPRAVRDVPEDQRRRFWQILDQYYAFIDDEVGRALQQLSAGDLLLVVSGFGMQPLNAVKQAIGRLLRDPDFSGTHERAPDGFLLAYGAAVEPGPQLRGSIVDVTPTLLYYLGLPVARDMDGFARADLFTKAFTAERPIAFIPSYSR